MFYLLFEFDFVVEQFPLYSDGELKTSGELLIKMKTRPIPNGRPGTISTDLFLL